MQRGDPRGELAVIHDRILEGERGLLSQARAIIEENLSRWLGFDVDVQRTDIDLDGDLRIEMRGSLVVTMRWGVINGWFEYTDRDDRVEQIWDRPEVRLQRFCRNGLEAGELAQFLERDVSLIAGVELASCSIGAEDLDAIAGLPGLRCFGAYDGDGVDDGAILQVGSRALERLMLAGGEVTPAVL